MTRLLIVDDEPDLRRVLRRLLEGEAFEVVEADNGRAALEMLATSRVDLVITDIIMPVMNGVELIERLRADPMTATIPVLAVTGSAHLVADADATVDKPYNWEKVMDVIRRLLGQPADPGPAC